MKIVFFGTPRFAVEILNEILSTDNEVLAVVTTPDIEKGRGLKVGVSDVKEFAIQNKLKILQPITFKDPQFLNELKALNAELFIVIAFRILPKEVYEMPKYGTFNLHGSLLPKYRGAAPIQWALIKGEKVTGVTTFKLSQKVDTGNIYLQKQLPIEDTDNFGILYDKLIELGKEAVLETIKMIENDHFKLIEQNDTLSTAAPKITKNDCKINWLMTAEEINNLIRGLSPFPGAFFLYKERMIKIFKAEVLKDIIIETKSIQQTKKELIIGCGSGALRILELQIDGKRRMGIEEFLRGFRFEEEYINEKNY